MSLTLEARLASLERRSARLARFAMLNVLTLPLLAFTFLGGAVRDRGGAAVVADSLRVRELVVVDSTGTVRLRLGAHLPDAVINGKRLRRGDDVAGVMLYDDTGVERGGYVTFAKSGNIALTLDTRTRQAALFAADPEEGAVAKLWTGKDWVEMRSGSDGSRLTAGRSGLVESMQPAMRPSEEQDVCRSLKSEIAKLSEPLPKPVVLEACRGRMTERACTACLR